MSRGMNQKLKLHFLREIMLRKTDKNHAITLAEIKEELAKREVTAERKSLYSDLNDLENFGITVEGEQKNNGYYYKVVKRDFEIAELKLLVDAIQSSKFITERKSRELIKKIEGFASEHEAKKLQRQVYVQGRIKTMNESVYNSVDAIHEAIENNKKIRFKYLRWNIKAELEERRGGEWYVISPWALTWDDENYYLVAYDSEAGKIKHYRVDKMDKMQITKEAREGRELFERFDLAAYAKKNFGMYGGRDERITIRLENDKIGIFIDRFGKDITIRKYDADHVEIRVNVAISGQFFGWIMGLGDGECVSFQNLDEKYCAKCMKSGKIHKECNISFNDPFMNFDGKVSDKAWDEFIYKTPRYELASWEYDMKGWPSCCDDFMKCLGDDNGEYKFVCNHCSKEITMELD